MAPTKEPAATANEPVAGCLPRLFWMMFGPATLVFLAIAIVQSGEGWFTVFDLAFLAVVAAIIGARWLDFRGGKAQTATGEPATPDHLRRYVPIAIMLGLGAWAVANVIGNHMLPG